MESNYGIAVTNKFALFFSDDDESDPMDILKLQEHLLQEKAKSTSDKTSKKGTTNEKDNKTSKNLKNKDVGQKKQTDQLSSATTTKKEDRPAKTKVGKGNENETREKRLPLNDNSKDAFVRRDGERPRPRSANFRPREEGNQSNRAAQGDVERRGFQEDDDQGFRERPNRGYRQRSENEPGFRGQSDGGDKVERSNAGEAGGDAFRGRGFGRRGGPGGRGRGRGGFDRGVRREFDRHSGSDRSGVKATDKREGAGAHNWGSVNDEIEEQLVEKTEGGVVESAEPVTQTPAEEVKPEGVEESSAVEAMEEEEPKVMTLDEWKSQEENRRVKAEFNIRKPGEGCSDPQWKKMFVLKKKEEEPAEEDEEDELDEQEQHGKSKNVVPIEIKFNTAVRRGGGGRGRGRGGFGGGNNNEEGGSSTGPRSDRGGDRPPRGGAGGIVRKQKAPNVADELDFPSLDKAVAQ